MDPGILAKRAALSDWIGTQRRVIVAYSGGVDSSFLAAVAHESLGREAVMATAVSPSMARSERVAARELARARGWNHIIVSTSEMDRDEYLRNSSDRCYWCKTELFEVLKPMALELGSSISVGTNVDDLGDHRPGQDAALENNVLTPLVDVGLTKSEIRQLSGDMGLPTADKPSSPCLSSRLAYGVRVTPDRLQRVDAAEEFLRELGFEVLRVRDHGEVARIEVPKEQIALVAEQSDAIATRFSELGFRYVTLDLTGFRSGSLNEVLPESQLRIRR
jgi:pyridinium-3,5-biscarboxylic acid mononucleotide sulfurtransferase